MANVQDTIHYMSNLDTTMTTSAALHACKTITQTNQPQKKALSHTHTHTHIYGSNGKEGRWWRTQRNDGTQERLRHEKKENHRFQACDKRVHFTLQGTHASSKQCHGREKQKTRTMNAMPSSYPHAVLQNYSTRPKKSIQEKRSKKKT